jgi:thioesterase DpgC
VRGGFMSHPRYQDRRIFSAGINLTHLYQGRISLLGFLLRRELGYISKFIRGLAEDDSDRDAGAPAKDKPWIAAVDTFAIGGGMQQLLAFDRVIAEEDAYFSLPAMREGIIPGAANLRLSRVIGPRLARQTIFWDRRMRADEPESRLVCDEVVAGPDMERAIEASVERLSRPAVPANRRMLHLAEEPVDLFQRYMAQYAIEQARLLHGPDLVDNLERTWIRRRSASSSR